MVCRPFLPSKNNWIVCSRVSPTELSARPRKTLVNRSLSPPLSCNGGPELQSPPRSRPYEVHYRTCIRFQQIKFLALSTCPMTPRLAQFSVTISGLRSLYSLIFHSFVVSCFCFFFFGLLDLSEWMCEVLGFEWVRLWALELRVISSYVVVLVE